MQASEVARAVAAATSTAASLGLEVCEVVTLNNSNKLTLRLLPCDVVARVSPESQQDARFEVDVAHRLAQAGSPVASLCFPADPRVHARDGLVLTFWTYYEPVPPHEPTPAHYAAALERLHAGMRLLDVPAPHYTDRVAQAQRLVESRERSPALRDADRDLLARTLQRMSRGIDERGRPEQLLHGEPHPGNVLSTAGGLMFIDFETCCRGPVEFDLAHAPDEVSRHYPGVDEELLRRCRLLVLAMITAWRWDPDDQLPNGRQLAAEWLGRLRAGL